MTERSPLSEHPPVYDPEAVRWGSYLKFWGSRGSVPVSGPEYTAFGGNTSCLEIHHHPGQAVIIDAGTGIRALGDELTLSDVREIHLFFGHTHWDHIIGFPFFAPLYNPEFTIHIYAQGDKADRIKEALSRVLKPDYFPVRLDQMQADIRYHCLTPGETVVLPDLAIDVIDVDHPGGAFAFRIENPRHKVGYATDSEFLKGYRGYPGDITPDLIKPYEPLIEFFQGVDHLIHEAQYTPREYRSKIGWGHSSTVNASILVELANVHSWYVTHHDPAADDHTLRRRIQLHWQVLSEMAYHCHVNFAFDGLAIPF